MNFYKVRAIIFVTVVKILSKILFLKMQPVVAVGAFIEKDGKMLFLDLSYRKGYGLPGGLLEGSETLEEGLVREIKEETGLDIVKYTYFGSATAIEYGVNALVMVFRVETAGEIKESIEGKLCWLDPREALPKMSYKNAHEALEKYLQHK
jgi:ADP-ribose pyrophosphatase YjhB (NUDIX family)